MNPSLPRSSSPSNSPNRISPWITALVAGWLAAAGTTDAAVRNWSGSGVGTDLNTAGSWDTLPVGGDSWVFGTTSPVGFTLTNNFAANFSVAGLTFSSGAPSYVINGGSITLTGGITNSSTNLQTFNSAIATTAVQTVTTTTGGGNVLLGGVISGAGGGLTVAGGGTLTLTAINTYTGATTINSGATLQLGNQVANNLNLVAASAITNNGNLIFAPGTTGQTYGNAITQSGTGTLILTGNATSSPASITLSGTANSIGGNIVLNQGRLVINALTNLGNATTPITINGSGTNGGQFWANAAIAIANPITFNGSAGPLEAAGNLGAIRGFNGVSYTGAWTLATGNSAINPESGNTVTVSGAITGPGGLIIGTVGNNRSGVVTITGANNPFTGGVQVSGATLNANAAGVLGKGAVTINNFSNSAFAQSVANALTGTNSLSILGGTATLGQSNNYFGGTTISGGTLNANAVGALGVGSLTQTGGTVNQSATNAFNGTLNLSGGTTNLSQTNSFAGANISGTNTTNVSAVGGLNGVTNVTGGTLRSSITSGPANNGSLNVSGGVLTSAVAGGQFQNVTLSGTGIINPGGVGVLGTGLLTISNLTTMGGTLQFDVFSPTSNDQLSVLNSFTAGAGTNIGFSSGLPTIAGTYPLIATSLSPNLANFVLPTAPSGQTYSLNNLGGFINLDVSGTYAGGSSNWTPTAAGPFSWNTAGNWSGGAVPSLGGDTANFNSALSAGQTVTVDGQQHVGTLTLNPSTAFGYTINQGTTGSTIYLDNQTSAAALNNQVQNNIINAPIRLVGANTNVNAATGTNLVLGGTINGAGKLSATGNGKLTLNGPGAWTGGTDILAGTVEITAVGGTASQINNNGVGIINLNGGTLSFAATTGQTTLPAGFVLNIGASGGSLNAAGVTTAGKVLVNATPGFLTGSGTFTKMGSATANGVLQVPSPSLNFTGNVNAFGLMEIQSVASLGFGTTAGFNGGTMTVGPFGDVVASGIQIFNPITLNGGILSANSGTQRSIFNNTVNVTAASTLRASQFQGTTVAENFAIGNLTGSGNLSVLGGSTGNAGVVSIGNASGYTGTITVGTGGILGIGNSSGANFFGSLNAISISTVNAGVALEADGNGTSTPETISYALPSNAINWVAANTTGYFVGKQGATVLSNQEANKTLAVTTNLPFNNTNSLNVTPLNGYGLLLANQAALTATTTYNVSGTQASNVVPGLVLSNLSGGFGIVKTGTGTLQLGINAADTTNAFGGAGLLIDITSGIVAASSDANLGAVGNGIKLNVNGATQGFRALDTFATSRVFTLAQANNGIDVVFGKTLTLNSGLAYSAVGNTFQKNDNGTLVLTAAASGSPTSGTTVAAGVLAITNSNQLGSGAITLANQGSSLALSGGGTITQAITLNASGISSARGALTNTAGATTVGGGITINGGSLITNEDAGNVFTLGAINNATTGFNVGGAGNTTIAGIISGGGVVQAVGPGTLRLTAANTGNGAFNAHGGPLVFSGAGSNGGGSMNINFGGSMTFDNSGTNVNNRNSTSGLGVAPHSLNTLGGGTFTLIGNNAATTTETILTLNVGRGQTNYIVTPSASQPANLTLTAATGSWTRAAFSTATFGSSATTLISGVGTGGTASASINTGAITAAGNFLGAGTVQTGTANMAILPWATVNSGGTISLATSTVIGANGYLRNLAAGDTTSAFVNLFDNSPTSTLVGTYNNSTTITTTNTTGLFVGQSVSGLNIPANNFITAINPGVSITINAATTGGATTNAPLTYSTTGTNINLTTAASGPTATLAQSINSLTLSTGGSLTLANSNQVLTLGGALGGAVLSLDSAATISGGQLTAGANELIFHTPSNLSVSSNIIGGGGGGNAGLTKTGNGTLTLTGNSFHNGQTILNAGTLNLNAGNNTIQYANYMAVNGGTVNLNGNSQIVTDLFSDSATASGVGTVGANSLITGTSGATLVLRRDSGRNYTGQIGGAVGVLVGGANANWTLTRDQLYSGPTLINGGNTILQNTATLGSTSSLTINGGNLTLDNNGSIDAADRLPDALPITLGNGGITYVGRTQFNSAETIGAITTSIGTSTLSVTQQTTNVSAATLMLGGGISRTLGTNVNFTNTNGNLGLIGSNPQILYTTAPTLSNSLIGGGYTVNNDWASYNATYGVGSLASVGFAGYSPLLLNNAGSTDNVNMSGNTGVNLNSLTINSLRAATGSNVNFNAGQTLTVASGGVLANNGITLTLGSAINNGNVTSGGTELFLTGSGTININSAITGSVSVVKSNGAVTLSGTNTYNGGTYHNGGTLNLANAGNVTTGLSTLGTGGIFVSSGTLNQAAGGVIPSQALTIYGATNSGASAVNLNSNLTINSAVTTAGSNVITLPNVTGVAVGQLVTGTGIPGGSYVTAVNPANNTVTITSGTGVAAGTNNLTFLVNNSLTNVTFNNTGGSTNPTLNITGVLNLPNATITGSSSNPATTSTIAGGNVDFNNAATPIITVNPISFNNQNIAPLQPTLAISSAIQGSSNAISVTGGGNLQLSGASNFTGGVTLTGNAIPSLATNLTIAANSTNMASGQPISGPLGTGTFTIGQNSTLLSTGAITVGNNVVVSGNFNFDAPSTTAASLTLGANNSTISLPASAATTINVNAPSMTGVLGGSVTGAGSSIVKSGLGTLRLDNGLGGASTFNGGVSLNAGTLIASGVGGTGTSLGSGTVTINGGVLALRHSGQTNNSVITYGNNVTINGTLANAFIDVNNNGANTGNTIGMGTLDYTGFTGGNPAPTTLLNVTGGNNYKLLFTGTTLTGATTSPTFNVGSGLSLILPGGFTIGTNLPKNIGTGTLVYSGSNLGATVSSPITGTVSVAPLAAQNNTPLGTGALTLNGGSTLNIAPLYSSSMSTTGYTAGGMTGKFYNTGASGMAVAGNYGVAPNSMLVGVQPNDSLFRQLPAGVNNPGAANTLAVYQSLLTVTTGGTYYFGGGSDDQLQVVVDGQVIQSDFGAHGLNQQALQSVALAAGTHTITVRAMNVGGGGSVNLFYSGPDTAANGITGTNPVSNLQALPLSQLSYATDYTSGNAYQNAAILNNAISVAAAGTAIIDGAGTDFNYAIPSLTLGNGSMLTAANGTGAAGSIGNGAFIVTGTTTLGTTGTLNPTTGTLVLAGGVTDGGNGLIKTGAGNVILGASAGTFTGSFNINGGFVTLNSGTSLTTGTTTIGVATTTPATLDLNGQTVTTTGNIILNGGAGPAARSSNAPAGLYNSNVSTASLPAGGTLSIGAATAAVNASVGGYGDIILNGVVQDSVAGSAWNKVGPNFLTLNGSNTFTGQLNIVGGKVILGNTSALGTVAGATVVSGGATLDLNGLTIGAEPVTLSGAGQTGIAAANALGALINSSATNASLSGNITLGAASSIGGPSLTAGTNGNLTLSGAFSGVFGITKVGANNLTVTNGTSTVTNFDVQSGSVTLSGAAKKGTGNDIIRQGATLTLDNSGTAVSARLGVSSPFITGNLTIIGNSSTAVNETFTSTGNNLNVGAGNGIGQATITINSAGTQGVSLLVNSTSTSVFNRGAGSTLLLRGDNLGNAPGPGVATIAGTSSGTSQTNGQSTGQTGVAGATNRLIYPWAVVDTSATGVGTSFAAYKDNTSGIQPLQAADSIATAPTIFTLSGNTANTNNTVTMTNTTGLVVGMLVTGTGIPAGTVINTVNAGVSIVLSGNATTTANNTLSFYGIGATPVGNIANLVSTNTTNSIGSAAAAQILNSLTLNNAAGSGTTITGGLQLDSGGILAVGTNGAPDSTVYTLGGAMLTGTNNFNRELVIHTTGTGTTLNITATIFVNAGGLTKADGGKLILGAAETYLGDTSLTGGLTVLNGGVNTIFKPFSTAPTSGNNNISANGGSFSGQNFTVNFGATLDLNGNNQAVANLRSGSGTVMAGGTIINGLTSTTATFHTALSGNQTWAGNFSNAGAGVLNFVRDGHSTFTVNSPNTFGGSATFTGGATQLLDLGTFENASSINVTRSALIWDNSGIQAVSNRLSATAPINLNGGGFQFRSRAASGATPVDAISLGTVNLGVGASDIIVGSLGQGSAAQITFAGIGTRAAGSTLNFGSATSAIGDNPRVLFTSAPTLSNGLIGAWATGVGLISSTGGSNAGFVTYDPASGVRVLQYQPNATYGSGLNTMLTGTATLPGAIGPVNTTTVNSLSIYNATNVNFVNGNDILLLESGGLLAGTDANNRSIGTTTLPGQIKSGSGNDLYIHNGANTLTINSRIIDNGSNNNVIFSALSGGGSSITLTNANTYGGTTYVSGVNLTANSAVGPAIPGNLVLSGSNSGATDSLNGAQTILNVNRSNQLVATANITINGGAAVNFGNGSNNLVANTQTINNLTFQNDGGTNSAVPDVRTGAGGLVINGTLSSINNTEVATIPVMHGFYTLTTGNIVVDANQYVPNQIGLALEGNITSASAASLTKTGNGWLGLGGQSANYTGAFNLNAGGLAVAAFSGGSGAVLGSQIIMAANTAVDSRGLTGTFGSIASTLTTTQILNGLQGTAGTVVTGLDNANASFAGTINSPYPTGLLNLTKIGTGNWELTNDSSATNNGTLTLSGGGVNLNGSGKLSFTTTTLQTGGSITLDNSTALSNRLGGAVLSTTAATLAPTNRTLNMNGGNLTIGGKSGTVISEGLGNIASISGGGIITLNAAGTAGVNVTLGQIAGHGNQTSLLIRGTGLGNAAGADVATLQFNTAGAVGTTPGLTYPGAQGGGANNTTTRTIRPDILVDNSATGTGAGFLTIDSTTGLVRPLGYGTGITYASELANTLTPATTATTNVGLATTVTGIAGVTANSITLLSGGGINLALVPTNPWGADGARISVNVQNSAGLLALTGNTGLTAGQYRSTTGLTPSFQVPAAANSFTLDAPINTNAGWNKAGAGTLILAQPHADAGTGTSMVAINGGTVQFAANLGANPIFVKTAATTPTGTALAMNNGILDLNGNNQLVGAVTTTNPLPFAGGTVGSPNSVITNSSATAATFTTNNSSSVIGTVFSGSLSLDKAGTGTMTLSSPQTYTGSTTIRGGTLTLRDSGSIASTGPVNVNYGILAIDNQGLSDSTTRLNSAAALNLSGASLRYFGSEQVETHNFGTVALNGGMNEINIQGYSSNAQGTSYTLNIANLTQSNNGSLNFVAANANFGNFSGANPHVYISQLNGAPFNAAAMTNGIIAPWMTVGQNDWATYTNANGITTPGANGAPGYSGNTLGAGVATDNISLGATVQNVTGRTINSLAVRSPGAGTTIGLAGALDRLTIGSGGVLINSAQTVAIQGGSLTSGTSSLYLNSFGTGVATINSPIVNNGATAVSVIRNGGGTVALTPLAVQTVASVPATSATITVPNSTGLAVGMGVSGSNITAGSTISAIAGNVITLSANTGGTAATTPQVTFAPAQLTTANGTVTAGSSTVTVAAASLPANFTPAAGMTIGSSVNILGGTTITNAVLATGTWTLTLSQNASTTATGTAQLVFNALSESFTGALVSGSGNITTTLGGINLSGLPGAITVPGDLTINNSTVTMLVNQGQIAASSNITLNGGSTLTLVGTNRLNNTLRFNNSGGGATPTVTVGTLLDIATNTASGGVINATNDNTAFTPTITGGTLNLSSATGTTINVAGNSPDGLIISSALTTNGIGTTTTTGQTIIKAGAGSLVLPNANAAVLKWDLNAGAIILNNATSLGAAGSTLAISGPGTLMAGNSPQTVATPITFSSGGSLTFGGTSTQNALTLSGAMNLGGSTSPVVFNVAGTQLADTISGNITNGTGGITKSGNGALTLSGSASNFTGPVTVSNGMLTLGNAAGFGGTGNATANYSISTTGAMNVNGFALAMGGLNGSGVVTNSGGVATLTLGGTSGTDTTTNATGSFSGVITNSTNPLSLFKVGIGTQTLTGANSFTGNVTIGQTSATPGGILAITNSQALGVGNKTVSIISNAGANQASLQLDGSTVNGPITLASNISFKTSQGSTAQPAIVNVAGNNTINGALTLTGGGGNTSVYSTTGILTMAGAVTTDTTGRTLILGGSSTGSGIYSGVIGEQNSTNKLILQKEGTNTWTLTNNNTYTGVTNVNGGKLALTGSGAIADVSRINLTANNSSLDISGISATSETVASVSGIAGSALFLGSKTLDLGSDNTSFEVASDVSGSGGSLKKSGSGTMTLSGPNNTYSGSTNLTGGTLLLGGNDVLPNGATFTLSTGTTLNTGGNSDATGAFSLGGNAVIDMGNASSILSFTDVSTWTGVLSVWNWNGSLRTAGGTDQLIFTGANGLVDLPNVNFYSGAGTGLLGGGGAVFDGTELVPVPEPGAVLTGALLLGVIGYRERRRRIGGRD